jgi:hypothetical protein
MHWNKILFLNIKGHGLGEKLKKKNSKNELSDFEICPFFYRMPLGCVTKYFLSYYQMQSSTCYIAGSVRFQWGTTLPITILFLFPSINYTISHQSASYTTNSAPKDFCIILSLSHSQSHSLTPNLTPNIYKQDIDIYTAHLAY